MTPNPIQQEFFEERAESWDEMVIHHAKKIEFILGFSDLKLADSVLDVGTGTGILIPFLCRLVGEKGKVTAVDYASNMISVAKRKYPSDQYPQVRFAVQDITSFPMNAEYNCIVCFSCFPHFLHQEATVKYLAKGLKTNGKLIIAHEESRQAINNLHKNAGSEVEEDYLPAAEVIQRYMYNADLSVIDTIDNADYFLISAQKL